MEDKDWEEEVKEEKEEGEGEEKEAEVVPEGKEIALRRGTTCLNCGVAFDREKIFCPQCGLRADEDKYLPSGTFISPGERVARGVGIFPLLSLLLGILGPIFLGIGWILAIVFGLISLSAIRKKGGLARDRKMALGGIILGLVWPIVIGLGIFFFSYRSASRRRIARNEVSAISNLRNIALTEKFAKSGFFFDRDKDGKSEYGNLADLAKVDFPYFPRLVFGKRDGYLFAIYRVTEEGFLAVATPLVYGITGKRTFSVDQSGILRGEDVGGKNILEAKREMPRIFPQSVFDEFDKEIAGDLLQRARREAKERNFGKARKILEEIRSHYYLSPASREVAGVMNSITDYIAGDKSKENYRKAKVLINGGKYLEALALLKATEKDYPKSYLVPEIRTEIKEAEKRLSGIREREAKGLFAQGQRFEVEGKDEDALKSYERIRQEFPSTSYFKRVSPLLNSVRKKIEEGKAEALFARLGTLKPGKDADGILRIISLLKAGYGKTDLVKSRQAILRDLQSRSWGQELKKRGLAEFKRKDYPAALKDLEEALRTDSGLAKELKIPLQTCNLKLGDKYFQEKNYGEAVVYYENYLKLQPARVELKNDRYNEAYYQLGKLEYGRGKLEKAKEYLFKVRYAFPKRPELYYLLGSILVREKDYAGAIGYFNIALGLKRNNIMFLYKRGLCRLALAEQLENELSGIFEKGNNSLKRGRDFVDAVAVIVNAAEAKGIQLYFQANPKLLRGWTQLTPQQLQAKMLANTEREKYLGEMRTGTAKLESNLQQNRSRQIEITTTIERTYENMVRGGNDLERAATLKEGKDYFSKIINPLRRKEQLFSQGRNKLEIGLNQERFVEENAFSALKLSLRALEKEKSVSNAVKEIKAVYSSLFMPQMGGNLQEGRELLKEAKAVEIPVEKYLSVEVIQ